MLLRMLIARRVFFKERNSQVGWFISEYSHSLHLSISYSHPPPHPLLVPQCKIWARQLHKSGQKMMRVGPLSPVGHQPGCWCQWHHPKGERVDWWLRWHCAIAWIRRTLIHSYIHTQFQPFLKSWHMRGVCLSAWCWGQKMSDILWYGLLLFSEVNSEWFSFSYIVNISTYLVPESSHNIIKLKWNYMLFYAENNTNNTFFLVQMKCWFHSGFSATTVLGLEWPVAYGS